MTKTEIYYFSGTGNSLFVARSLSEKLGGTLIPIVPLLKKDTVETNAEVIGLVFPIYDFKAPPIIQSFAKKFSKLDAKYVFAVATYGFMPMKAMKKLEKSIQSSGGKLSGGFVVKMPNNGIITETITAKTQNKMRKDWKSKLEKMDKYVAARKEGKIETSSVLTNLILNGLFIKATPKLLRLAKEVALRGWKSFAFVADSNCSGCGICVQVCPMDNIALNSGKPSWGKDCATCFACLQWCPKEAIQAGRMTVNKKRYHHPDVKISDIIKQKTPIATM
jgi:flavodoxin/NAD-dependent dihydropyrimidine dehydrogenase PreA subunit